MKIYYLEVVTNDVDKECERYAFVHNVTFGEPEPSLGGACVVKLENGSLLGIRAPMRETESPTVRHYMLVDDIESAVAKSAQLGAEIAVPPMVLPGFGQCAIVIQNGVETGFWQL